MPFGISTEYVVVKNAVDFPFHRFTELVLILILAPLPHPVSSARVDIHHIPVVISSFGKDDFH
jgi:hypothetical protein